MRITRFIIALTVFSSFTIVKLHAQVGENLPTEWTLQDCLTYAKAHNISINSLRLNEKSAEQDLLQAKASKLPSLSGSVSQGIESLSVNNSQLQLRSNFSNNIGVSSSVVLYNSGYINNNIKSKDLSVKSANLSVSEAENNISINIAEAYLNILMVQENIVYLQNLLSTTKSQLAQAENQYKFGSIAKKDYLQFQSQVANDEYNLVNAQNQLRSDIVNLKQILQLPSDFDFQIVKSLDVNVGDVDLALKDAQQKAQASRPEIENSQLGVEIAETELKKSKANGLPVLSAGGGINTSFADHQGTGVITQWGDNFYQSVGLSLSIPIYNQRLYKTAVEKAKINIEQAQLTKLNTETVLNQEVEQAYINLENSIAQYKAAAVQYNINKETYDISTAELKLGNINLVALQQQRSLYIQALQAYIQAKYSAVLNQKIYEFYTGQSLTL
ncbi:TolC family protein [Soonwooa sp.]|uniref:TolC family protein n=1 Tax=Soonwooa sp. TaxID=1938592 RepID=UPI00260ECF7B|nr:TolC family protein [Soonwooa sp.]